MSEFIRSDVCRVDISKSLLRTYAGVVLATGDKNANRFGAILHRAGEAVDLTGQGVSVTGYFMRPDAETVVCVGTAEGNTVYVDLPAACYTQEGRFSLAIKVSSTEVTQTVRVVDGCIRLTQTETLVDPGEVVPSLDELLAYIAAMEAATAEAKEAATEADAARAGIQGDLDAIEAKINNVVQEIGGVNLFDVTADVTSGFVMSSGISTVGSYANYTTSDYILLDAGTYTVCFSQASTLVSRFPVGVYSYPSKTQTGYLYNNAQVKTYTFELEEKAYIRFSSYTPAYTMLVRGTDIPAVYTEYTAPELVLNEDIGIKKVDALESQVASILPKVESLLPEVEKLREQSGIYGKKWAALGDSFTAFTDAVFESGIYAGAYKTYPRIIAEKNAMDLVSVFFESGRTLAYPANGSFKNSITCPTAACYYKNIPEDVDYITIYLGINDSHHAGGSSGSDGEDVTGSIPLGTINDTVTSTHYGAWNVVLTWLLENRPFAHIGIIVSNGCDTPEYRTAQIAIAQKYGVPYIDLNGDDRTPVMIRSQNPAISSTVKTIIDKKQSVDYDGTATGSMNRHPNSAAHEYESSFIEEFLRSL